MLNENQNTNNLPEANANPRKIIERAMILPLVALILLIPPLASIFEIDARPFGIPFTLLYLFVIWGILIFSTYKLSRRLQQLDDKSAELEGPQEADRDTEA